MNPAVGSVLNRFISVVIAAFIALAFVIPASAQTGGSYTSSLGSHSVVWDGNWVLDEDAVMQEDSLEGVILQKDVVLFQLMFFPSGLDLEELRGIFTDGFAQGFSGDVQTLDAGAYSNVAYQLDLLDLDGIEMGLFLVLIDRGSDSTGLMFGAPVSMFGDEFTSAQSEVTVDGEQVFKGVDGHALEGMLEAAAPTGASTSSQGSTSTNSQSEPNASANSDGQTYTSSQWGYTVNYSSQWTNNTGTADLGEFSLISSAPLGVVSFEGFDTQGVPLVLVHDAVFPVFQESLPTGSVMIANVVGGDRLFLAASTPDGVFAQEIISLPSGVTVMVTMLFEGNPETMFPLVNGSVSVDGLPLFESWALL